jgi:hypothetical protein
LIPDGDGKLVAPLPSTRRMAKPPPDSVLAMSSWGSSAARLHVPGISAHPAAEWTHYLGG